MKEVATKTNDVAGDGTTTATVLAQAIVREGLKNVAAGANPLLLKRGIERRWTARRRSRSARWPSRSKSQDAIAQVAASPLHDQAIGDLIAEAMEKVGKDGVITVEESKSIGTTLEVVEGHAVRPGLPLRRTWSPTPSGWKPCSTIRSSCSPTRRSARSHDIVPVLEKIIRRAGRCVIIAEDVEGEALATLVVNKIRGALQVVAVKAPGFGDRRKAMLEDIAVAHRRPGHLRRPGRQAGERHLDMLGQAATVRVTKDETTIVEGKGSNEAIQGRIAQIEREIEETDSDYDREKLQERLAKLAGGVAVIQVGAATETELKEKKQRIEDACPPRARRWRKGSSPAAARSTSHARRRWTASRPRATSETGVQHRPPGAGRAAAAYRVQRGRRGLGHRRAGEVQPAGQGYNARPASSSTW